MATNRKMYDEPMKGIVVTKNGLNVRKKPSLNANILYTLKPNEEILVEGETGKFFIISTSYGISGFCVKEFISIPKSE